jgi:hypothetical protein
MGSAVLALSGTTFEGLEAAEELLDHFAEYTVSQAEDLDRRRLFDAVIVPDLKLKIVEYREDMVGKCLEWLTQKETQAPAKPPEAKATMGKDQTGAPVRCSPKALVDAAKRQSKRSYEKFAAVIGIGKDTLYAITKETRWVSDETYDLVAQACKCKPEDLHPRDIPRPERRRG